MFLNSAEVHLTISVSVLNVGNIYTSGSLKTVTRKSEKYNKFSGSTRH